MLGFEAVLDKAWDLSTTSDPRLVLRAPRYLPKHYSGVHFHRYCWCHVSGALKAFGPELAICFEKKKAEPCV